MPTNFWGADISSKKLFSKRREKLKLIAPMIGCSLDDLVKRERSRYIAQRLCWGTFSVILIGLAVWFTVQIQAKSRLAENANKEVETQRELASSAAAKVDKLESELDQFVTKIGPRFGKEADASYVRERAMAIQEIPPPLENLQPAWSSAPSSAEVEGISTKPRIMRQGINSFRYKPDFKPKLPPTFQLKMPLQAVRLTPDGETYLFLDRIPHQEVIDMIFADPLVHPWRDQGPGQMMPGLLVRFDGHEIAAPLAHKKSGELVSVIIERKTRNLVTEEWFSDEQPPAVKLVTERKRGACRFHTFWRVRRSF